MDQLPHRLHDTGGPEKQDLRLEPALGPADRLTDLYNTPGCDDFGEEGFVFVFAARHNGGNNYLFYDGHVKWMNSFLGRNWRASRTEGRAEG